jgi:hypothetical protein
MQVEHSHSPSAFFFVNAEGKEKVGAGIFEGFAVVLEPEPADLGRGASQIVHFSVALEGFLRSHVEHFHSPSTFDAGRGKVKGVAAGPGLKVNPGWAEDLAIFGRGASQIVHFSVALAGFLRSHVEHFHSPSAPGV